MSTEKKIETGVEAFARLYSIVAAIADHFKLGRPVFTHDGAALRVTIPDPAGSPIELGPFEMPPHMVKSLDELMPA